MLTIRLFGALEARLDDTPLARLHAREGGRLLAYFTLKHGVPIPYRTLAEIFWPAEARSNPGLQGDFPNARQAVYSLRQALGGEAPRLASPGKGTLCLNLAGADVDVLDFDRLSISPDAPAWAEAVALYQGPLLDGWSDPWVLDARVRRKRVYERLLRRLIAQGREGGRPEQTEAWLRRGQASSPDDESWTRELMELLASSGRFLIAEETYEEIRALLQAQGKTISEETERLFARLRFEAERASVRIRSTESIGPEIPAGATVRTPVPERPDLDSALQGVPPTAGDRPATLEETRLEPTGGAVPLDSPFYIARPADERLRFAIARADSIVLVKGARQMGKTSLLARGMQQARAAGARVALTDFQSLNAEQVESTDRLFLTLATGIAVQIGLEGPVRKSWDPEFGASLNLEIFLQQHVLNTASRPFVWAMDEVDRLFTCPFRNEVFGLFRSWHNRRSLDPGGAWGQLTLAMAYASEAHLFITDVNQSPFNVGTRITLDDFTLDQVRELNERYGAPLRNAAEISRFHHLLAGHPFLTRCGLDELATGHVDLAGLESAGSSEDGPFGEHLRRIWNLLSREPELVEAAREMLYGRDSSTPDLFYRLRAAGIAVGEWGRDARLRCPLYAAYLAPRLTATTSR